MRFLSRLQPLAVGALCALLTALHGQDPAPPLELKPGQRILVLGNTFAERLGRAGHLEAAIHRLRPELGITVRHLGWSGDEVALRPRPLNYPSLREQVVEHAGDVLITAFGLNESWRGEAGQKGYFDGYTALLEELRAGTADRPTARALLVVGPIAHELHGPPLPDSLEVAAHNAQLAAYSALSKQVAGARGAAFVDLYAPTAAPREARLTINGIHLNDAGERFVLPHLLRGLGIDPQARGAGALEDEAYGKILALVRAKDEIAFHRIRPVNGEYVFGRRHRPFGIENFPTEMKALDELLKARDAEIHALARELVR